MLGYYLDLAWRSLKRNRILTTLMVALIGVGVAAAMTTFAALSAVSDMPVPDGRAATLFVPQIDNQGPAQVPALREPPMSLSYIDAMALLHAGKAVRQTIAAPLRLVVEPARTTAVPFTVKGYATTSDFFAMFAVPFRYGASWPATGTVDAVVIGGNLNRKLFGGGDSVGRAIHLGGHTYTVAGVLGHWNPQPRFYAGSEVNAVTDHGEPPQLFVSFSSAVAARMLGKTGSIQCPKGYAGSGWEALLASECDWISAWVELPTRRSLQQYRGFLRSYAEQQQSIGRFHWPPNIRLRSLPQWLQYMHAIPQENRMAFVLAIGLGLVCLLNTLGLLLARFMRRRGEIGTRRAMGASRGAIAAQFVTEAGLVGLAGGLLGLLLTTLGVGYVGSLFGPKIARLVHVDTGLLVATVLVSIAVTLLVALYPVWRASRLPPALQLKSN